MKFAQLTSFLGLFRFPGGFYPYGSSRSWTSLKRGNSAERLRVSSHILNAFSGFFVCFSVFCVVLPVDPAICLPVNLSIWVPPLDISGFRFLVVRQMLFLGGQIEFLLREETLVERLGSSTLGCRKYDSEVTCPKSALICALEH